MNHLSDRRRAECALLPRLLLGIANDGGFRCYDDAGNIIDGAEAAVVEEMKAQLTEASVEPIADLEAGGRPSWRAASIALPMPCSTSGKAPPRQNGRCP